MIPKGRRFMKNKIVIISAFIILVIVIMYSISQGNNQNSEFVVEGELIMKLFIYPNRSSDPGYVFSISTDQMLQVQVIDRYINETKVILLTNEKFQFITGLLEELNLDETSDDGRLRSLGGWDVRLFYNGVIYESAFWHNPHVFLKLVDEIIELSSIEIEIHG